MSQLALDLFDQPRCYHPIDEFGRHPIYGGVDDYGPAENITFQEHRVIDFAGKDPTRSSLTWAWNSSESEILKEIAKSQTALQQCIKRHNEVRGRGLQGNPHEPWREQSEKDHILSYLTALNLTRNHCIYHLDIIEALSRIHTARFPTLTEAST